MDLSTKLRFSPGCRLHPSQPILLVPEGMLELTGPSRDILSRLDGQKTIATLIDELLGEYAGAPREEVERDVLELLVRIRQRGLIRSE
jgi:pyrroloquinoline quinone biosynthesis protein D